MTFENQDKIATRIESLEQLALKCSVDSRGSTYILMKFPFVQKKQSRLFGALGKSLDEDEKTSTRRQHQYRTYVRSAESSLREVEDCVGILRCQPSMLLEGKSSKVGLHLDG